jgi:hypothetical protein
MSDGSKCRHLKGDELSFTSLVSEEKWMKWRGDYNRNMIAATLPVGKSFRDLRALNQANPECHCCQKSVSES